jgi:hypothetical protein
MFASPKVFECDRNHLFVVKEEADEVVRVGFGVGAPSEQVIEAALGTKLE